MRQNPHVRICGGPGSATTLVYLTIAGAGGKVHPSRPGGDAATASRSRSARRPGIVCRCLHPRRRSTIPPTQPHGSESIALIAVGHSTVTVAVPITGELLPCLPVIVAVPAAIAVTVAVALPDTASTVATLSSLDDQITWRPP